MTTSAPQTVAFSSNTYTLVGMTPLGGAAGSYTVDLAGDDYQTVVTTVDFGGDALVVFDMYGSADSDGVIVIASDDMQRTIVLDGLSGSASVN